MGYHLRMLKLDPDDPRPPYAQVVDALRREIELGALPSGTKLPTHEQLRLHYGVSVGTIKRALGELQGAGLIVSRQGQGAFVRTQRSLLETVPHSFSADVLTGHWLTCYQFVWEEHIGFHADITKITAHSDRRLTARNYPPEPRTQGHLPAFRNDIEAQLANRHVIGYWRNTSDTRYFGTLHLAVLPGEAAMEGYYTGFGSDIKVHAMRWVWVRLDPVSLSGVDLAGVVLKPPDVLYARFEHPPYEAPLKLAAISERGTS